MPAKQAKENEINLVFAVRDILIGAGLLKNVEAHFDTNLSIQYATQMPFDQQRFYMNQYWITQLMCTGKNTMEERFCLIDTGTAKDWIHLFKERLLPFIISNQLPTGYV